MDELKITYIPLKDLKPYKNNPKRHSKEQIEHIANSLEEFGWKQAIVIDADNTIIAGHCRYLAAKKLKYKTVPCIIADDLTEEQIRAYRLLDNRLSENDYDLSIEFAEMQDIEFDFEPFGIVVDDFSIDDVEDNNKVNEPQGDYWTTKLTFPMSEKDKVSAYLRKHKEEIQKEIIERSRGNG